MKSKSVAIFALFAVTLTWVALADVWNKKTVITVNEPLQLPGVVLQPGKYVMKLADSPSNRHIVQVFNEKENRLITTILAINNYRLRPTGKTEFGFWETPKHVPVALRAWFYPGDNFGQEFVYPRAEVTRIEATAVMNNEHVPVLTEEMQAEIRTPMKTEEATVIAKPVEVAPPAPARVVEETATVTTATETTAAELPTTASPLPFLALFGVLSTIAGIGFRAIAKYLP